MLSGLSWESLPQRPIFGRYTKAVGPVGQNSPGYSSQVDFDIPDVPCIARNAAASENLNAFLPGSWLLFVPLMEES